MICRGRALAVRKCEGSTFGAAPYNDVAPGEFYLHPNDVANSAVRFAFTVPEAGSYLVTYVLRD